MPWDPVVSPGTSCTWEDKPRPKTPVDDAAARITFQRKAHIITGWDNVYATRHWTKDTVPEDVLCNSIESSDDMDDEDVAYLVCYCGTIHSDEGKGKCCTVSCQNCITKLHWNGHRDWQIKHGIQL